MLCCVWILWWNVGVSVTGRCLQRSRKPYPRCLSHYHLRQVYRLCQRSRGNGTRANESTAALTPTTMEVLTTLSLKRLSSLMKMKCHYDTQIKFGFEWGHLRNRVDASFPAHKSNFHDIINCTSLPASLHGFLLNSRDGRRTCKVPELNVQYRARPHPRMISGELQPSQLECRRIYLVCNMCLYVSHLPTEDNVVKPSRTIEQPCRVSSLQCMADFCRHLLWSPILRCGEEKVRRAFRV